MVNYLRQLRSDLQPFLTMGMHYRWQFALGLLLALVTLLSSIGLLALSGWFISATAVAGLTVATAQAFNFFTPGAGVRGFSIARTASRYGERLASHDATFQLLAGLRVWFFSRLAPLVPAALKRTRQSELLNRLVADIDTLDGLYLRLISPFLLAVAAVFVVVTMAFASSTRTGWFLMMVLVPAVTLLPCWFFQMGMKPGQQILSAREQLRNRLMDFVAGQTELQVYGATGRYQQAVHAAESQLHRYTWQMIQLTGLSMVLLALLTGLAVAGVLWAAAMDIGGNAQLGYVHGPIVVMLALATLAAFEAIMPLPAVFQMLGQTQSAARRLLDITEQEPLVTFPTEDQPDFNGADLCFSKVAFGYRADELVVQDFSLTVTAHERVALVGPTGVGKSTLLQLITREWPLGAGTLSFGGVDIGTLSEQQLRRAMAVMPQRVHIFSATLRDNLLLAIDPTIASEISDADLYQVLADVGLSHIAEQDELLNIWLGATGQGLSGGEQRRLGLARVLLRLRDQACSLVLLDEPTEGLDPETEQRMIALLERALVGKTLLMVTHRPAVLALVQRTVALP